MRILLSILILIFLIGCNTRTDSSGDFSDFRQDKNLTTESSGKAESIYDIDFKNFTYPWTEKFGDVSKTFKLENGMSSEEEVDKRTLSLENVIYQNVNGGYGDKDALVTIRIDDGNATYHIIYIYELENNKPKLFQNFEFDETDKNLIGISLAHGELIIETFIIGASDAQCCPSIIERKYYEWREDKFVLVSTQEISNDYLERQKNNGK